MIKKVLSILFLASLALAQDPLLYCNLVMINQRCTCNFVIYNPNGFNNLTITANPSANCTSDDVVDATGSGYTKNVPSVLCTGFPMLETLRMERLGVDNVLGNPFRYCTNLRQLHLGDNSIAAIPALTFTNTGLEILELNKNNISSINSLAFDSLINLERLDLSYNSLTAMTDDVFDHLENLRTLHMSYSRITSFTPRLFEFLTELRVLDISGNQFGLVGAGLFSTLGKLESLNLANCGLTGVTASAFQNSTELLKLNLENNNIRNFVSNLFENQQKLRELSLANNGNGTFTFQLLRPLTSMRILSLSNCFISSINSNWFDLMTNLIDIDLSSNNLAAIPENTFAATDVLTSINFNNNKLQKLSSRSFGSLEKLHSLYLENNSISQIDFHFLSQSKDLVNAYLGHNNCTSFNTDSFNLGRSFYMIYMKTCFDNYDRIPISIRTFNSSNYDWYSIRTDDGWDALEVYVEAFENVHIALTNVLDRDVPLIEIQIGQDRSRRSHILEHGNIVFNDTVRYRLHLNGTTFIIGWRFNIVMVFIKGEQFPFMAHTRSTPYDVNFFGLRTLFEDDEELSADWVVSRIQTTSQKTEMREIYEDIEARMRNGLPVDLDKYVRRREG